MEALAIILVVVGILLTCLGIIGCIAPGLPGPVLSYLGLIAVQFTQEGGAFSWTFLLVWAAITAIVSALDYVLPIYTTKRFGGTRWGLWGGVIGMFAGIFLFPPFGIILGPLVGAVAGDLLAGKQFAHALKSGIGSFIGFVLVTILKLAVCIIMAVYLTIEVVKVVGDSFGLFA